VSADNWSVCPRCWDDAQRKADEAKVEVMGLYGAIPVEEFDKRRDALEEPDPDTYTTFREDYEFYGADKGEVHASYRGGCSACGLSVELKASKRFWPDEAAS
jgi:hypothetical protein